MRLVLQISSLPADLLRKLLKNVRNSLKPSSVDGANVDEMLARLSERFGASDEEEGSSVNAEAAEEEEIRIDLFADKKGGGE